MGLLEVRRSPQPELQVPQLELEDNFDINIESPLISDIGDSK
jgi:hypothetical protein